MVVSEFFPVLGFEVGAHKKHNRNHGKDDGCDLAARKDDAGNKGRKHRSRKRGQKPSADDGENARNTVNGRLTVPGAVRET